MILLFYSILSTNLGALTNCYNHEHYYLLQIRNSWPGRLFHSIMNIFYPFSKEENKSQENELLSQCHLKDPLTCSNLCKQSNVVCDSSEEKNRPNLSHAYIHRYYSGRKDPLQRSATTSLKHWITLAEKISISYNPKCQKLVLEKLARWYVQCFRLRNQYHHHHRIIQE